ncbi:MAG: GerMN domain-containing protein [Treponema sp.]|jgi:hypothetical protein|nr:GerMN domain-containing protein [Treponema sp.]
MIFFIKDILRGIAFFLRDKGKRRLIYLLLLSGFAFAEFMISGLVRRTFVFYSNINGTTAVEDRMLPHSLSREIDIRRYVEEALLGPVSPDSAPLFPQETRLRSLLYRDGVVYADLSEAAAFLPAEGGDVFRNLSTLEAGIRRNFSFVRDIKLFIAGHEVLIASTKE